MTPEQATALRKPFPKSAIGVLPKPFKRDSPKGQCRECGGYHGMPAVHLDYVGHAATTDRLLTVDPDWSWEPMGVDQFGLPAPDAQGNLWIRLTVGGVTRIGVGDGNSAKERIGDAIRNAAMRFGVALDLWSKEELEQAHGPAMTPPISDPDEPPVAAVEPDASPSVEPGSEPLLLNVRSALAKRMYASINQAGINEAERLPYISSVIGHDIGSSKEMTEDDARLVIDRLADVIEQPFANEASA